MDINDFPIEAFKQHINLVLSQYSNDNSVLDVSELDGYVAAILCAPEDIPVSRWVVEIWGGEDNTPDWQSEQEINEYVSTFVNYFALVAQDLERDQYSPLFAEQILDKTKDTRLDEWSFGFMRGIKLWQNTLSSEQLRLLQNNLQALSQLSNDEQREKLKTLSPEEFHSLEESIKLSVMNIYHAFH